MPGNDPFKGHASQIAYGVESTQGSPVAPKGHLQQLEEETEHNDPEVDYYQERVIGGDRELYDQSPGQTAYEGGSYPLVLVDAVPLAWAFGHEDYDGNNNEHTLRPAGVDGNSTERPRTLTIEATQYGRGGGDDFVRTFAGVGADTLTLGTDNDSRLTAEIDTVGLGVTTSTSSTDVGSYADRSPWIFSDVTSDLSINGTPFARVTDFEFTLENNISARHYITSNVSNKGDPYELIYGNVTYDYSATITVDDDTLYQEVRDRNALVDSSVAFTRANGDTLTINVSDLPLSEATYPTPRGEGADDEIIEVEPTGVPGSVEVIIEDSNRASAVF